MSEDIFSNANLPEDVAKELLQKGERDKIQQEVLALFPLSKDGVLTLDQLISGLYNKYTRSVKRNFLSGFMFRLVKDGVVYQTKKKRGVYTLNKPDVTA